ncbi:MULTISPECIES: hypothetical protein [Haloarcula]|uniref:hypothetical protein n=1 Tax=Haloarcula TaxID=2237 RepID=UPI0023E8647B|nr:hypothetical protein [Halomicroarcula sp. SHR3]
MDVSLPAVSTIAIGVGLLVLGVDFSLLRRVRSAGRFDLATGTILVVLGTIIHVRGLQGATHFFIIPLVYFLIGVAVFRTYYELNSGTSRRDRDLLTTALPGIFGVCGLGSTVLEGIEVFIITYLLAILTSIVALVSLLYDGSRLVRGLDVKKRDVLVETASVPLGYAYTYLTFMDFYPPP